MPQLMATAGEPSVPAWARLRLVALLVLGVAVAKLLVSGQTELVRDEGYYALWSFHPSLGYFDHAPMVAWMISAGRALLGENEIGVRLPAILSGLAIAAAQWRVGRLLFSQQSAALAVYFHAAGLAATLLLLVMTPDVPSTLFWTLGVWALAELQTSRNANWWLAIGLSAGLGLLSKYTNVFLGAGILMWIIASKGRWHWLRSWQFWTGGGVAVLLFVPVVAYNASHGWEGFAFQAARTTGEFGSNAGIAANLLDFVLASLLLYTPVVAVLAFIALFAGLARSSYREGLQLVGLTALPLLLYFTFYTFGAKVQANWTMPVWPMLLVGAAGLCIQLGQRLRKARPWLGALVVLNLAAGAGLGSLVYVQAIFHPFSAPSIDRTQEMHGWRELARHVISEADSTNAKWIAVDTNYSLTGLLAFYIRAEGSTLPVRDISEAYRYRFQPQLPGAVLAAPAILVQEGPVVKNDTRFAERMPLAPFVRQVGGDRLGDYQLFFVTGATAPVFR